MLTWIIQKTYSLPNRIVLIHLISLRRMSPSDSSYQGSGGNIHVYGRVLAPEILRAFSADFCRRWPIHTKKEGIAETRIRKILLSPEWRRGRSFKWPQNNTRFFFNLCIHAYNNHSWSKHEAGTLRRKTKHPPEAFSAFLGDQMPLWLEVPTNNKWKTKDWKADGSQQLETCCLILYKERQSNPFQVQEATPCLNFQRRRFRTL